MTAEWVDKINRIEQLENYTDGGSIVDMAPQGSNKRGSVKPHMDVFQVS